MPRNIIGIDLGHYSVKVVELEHSKNKSQQIRYYEECLVFDKSAENEDLSLVQEQALQKIIQKCNFQGNIIGTMISSSDAVWHKLSLPFSDKNKINAVLPGELEGRLPFDTDDLLFSWYKNLANSSVNDISVALTKRDNVEDILKLLSKYNIDPPVVSFAPFSLFYLAAPSKIDKSKNYIIVDIGHQNSNICICSQGEVVLARALHKAGGFIDKTIAQSLNIPLTKAQEKKHGMSFDSEEDAKILTKALMPIISELRQTICALPPKTDKYNLYLTGGSSKLKGLEQFLVKQLPVKICSLDSLGVHIPRQFAAALSCARLNKMKSSQKFINFRVADLAWRGKYDYLRQKMLPLAAWGLLTLFLLGNCIGTKASLLKDELVKLKNEQQQLCKKITGKSIRSSQCLALISQEINAGLLSALPDETAVDMYLEVVRLLPKELDIKVSDLDIREKSIRMRAKVKSFEDVDKIVAALSSGRCFTNVVKGKARQLQGSVSFQISLQLDCDSVRKNAQMGSKRV